jgi:hypothetical protein
VRGSGQPALCSLLTVAVVQPTIDTVALCHVVPDSLRTVAAVVCACACGSGMVGAVLMSWPCAASVPRPHCGGGAFATRKPGISFMLTTEQAGQPARHGPHHRSD